ncbi:hypothetical protein [Pontimicrobium sp. MEBiC06410]
MSTKYKAIIPLLRDIEEDVILFADKKGIDIDELVIEIDMESTFIPCTICKREILLRQQNLGQYTTINVDYVKFPDGEGDIDIEKFKRFLKE